MLQHSPTVIVKSGLMMDGYVPTLANYEVASNDIEDILSDSILLLQGITASDHIGSTRKQRNSFVLVTSKNENKLCIWVEKLQKTALALQYLLSNT